MPISPRIVASTEQNACTSPLQQPFNNLNNQARLSTPQHGLHSTLHFSLTRTNLLHLLLLLFFSILIGPALPSYSYTMQRARLPGLVSEGVVRNTGNRRLMSGQHNRRKKKKKEEEEESGHSSENALNMGISLTDVKSISLLGPNPIRTAPCTIIHPSLPPSPPRPPFCPFVCPTFSQRACQRNWTRQLSNPPVVSEDGRWGPVFFSPSLSLSPSPSLSPPLLPALPPLSP